MMRQAEALFGHADVGTVFDCHHGIYVYDMVCEWAHSLGWAGPIPDGDPSDTLEELSDLCDDALTYVNEHHVADGYRVDWWEGSIMLWSDAEWEEAYA